MEVLRIENRTEINDKENKRLRQSGYLLSNICSKEIGSVSVAIQTDPLRKALRKAGRSAVFKLESAEGKSYDAMVKDIQIAPLSGEYVHITFQQVSLSQETKANVAIKIEGREALEAKKITVNHQIDEITVIGLPQDIPNVIVIDVTELQPGDNIHVRDIKLPDGIVTDLDPEKLVITIAHARSAISANEEESKTEE